MSRPNIQTITVEKIDVDLLREQRDWLLRMHEGAEEHRDGLVHMCDAMLDIAEGFTPEGD